MTSLERFQQQITDAEIERWQGVFVQIRVGHEILKMEEWIRANEARANKKKNFKRFAVNWLAKAERDMEAIDQREITRHEIDRLRSQGYHIEGTLTRMVKGNA